MLRKPGIPTIQTVGVFEPESPTLIAPDFQLITPPLNWLRNWTTIVTGKFSNSAFSCLLCYDSDTGHAGFYQLNGSGGLQLLQEFTDWRTTWTYIVPGAFGDSGYDGLLLYDQGAGFAAFYDTDGQGNLTTLREYNDWRTTWTHIVAAPFDDSKHSGVLLYDQSAGFGAIYGTDGHGNLKKLREYDDWRTTWTAIVPGQLSDKGSDAIFADLFFYEGSSGYGETYATDGKGGIAMLSQQSGFPQATDVIGGNFGCMGNGQEWTNLIFFNRPTNVGTIFAFSVYVEGTQEVTEWKPVEIIRPLAPDPIIVANPRAQARSIIGPIVPSRPWSLIATGNFWMIDPNDGYFGSNGKYPQYRTLFNGGCTDFLFYDRERGAIQFYLKETAETTPQEKLCGYASVRSLLPGETIQFHISSKVGPYRIGVYRQSVKPVFMGNIPVDPGLARPYGISRKAFEDGAQWPAVASLVVPSTWPSGLYLARVQAGGPPFSTGDAGIEEAYIVNTPRQSSATAATAPALSFASRAGLFPDLVTYDIPFAVRSVSPGAQARILLAASDTTYEAYNYWGGRSLYGHGCSGLDGYGNPGAIAHIWSAPYGLLEPRALKVSFLRPFASAVGVSRMQTFEIPMIQWLERNGFRVDVCAASDLHKFPDLLSNYRLFLSVGHDEYWSKEMRDNVENFVDNGGNAAFLSGNTCYWAVHLTLDGNSMICTKDKALDPDTILWNDLNRPATSMIGTDDYNVWPNVPPDSPAPGQNYTLIDESHWAFEGTNLSNNDTFGVYLRPDGIFVCAVGGETNNGAKSGVLATATFVDTSDHNKAYVGTMVSFQKGKRNSAGLSGVVFNAASINWVTALSQQEGLWNSADQITWNVMNRLG